MSGLLADTLKAGTEVFIYISSGKCLCKYGVKRIDGTERDPTIRRVSSIALPCTATNQPSRGTNLHFFLNLARAAVIYDD